jgi:hypothetical protein
LANLQQRLVPVSFKQIGSNRFHKTLEQKLFAQPEQLAIADRFRYMTLRNGIRYETEWLAWCEEAIAFLSAEGNQSQA